MWYIFRRLSYIIWTTVEAIFNCITINHIHQFQLFVCNMLFHSFCYWDFCLLKRFQKEISVSCLYNSSKYNFVGTFISSDLASAHHFHHLRKEFTDDENILDRFRHLKFEKCIKKSIQKVFQVNFRQFRHLKSTISSP